MKPAAGEPGKPRTPPGVRIAGGRGRTAVFVVLGGILMTGCAPLLTGTDSVEDALKILAHQNARGCLYIRGNARPYADVTALLVGTWGQDPPLYADCWQGLPTGNP